MNLTGKKILVTGASGFVGSFVVEQALAAGAEVWAALRATSSRRYLPDPRIRFIELNLGDHDKTAASLARRAAEHGAWDYIVHAAGITKSIRPSRFYEVNTVATEDFASLVMEHGLVKERFVFVSSLSACGPVREERIASHVPYYAPITPADTPRPDTAYGISKLEAEKRLRTIDGLPLVIVRPTGVYGPRDRDYFVMAQSIARGMEVTLGRQPQMLSFVFVRDLAEAILLACERGKTQATYFVSDGEAYEDRYFTLLLKKALGKRHTLRARLPEAVVWLACAACGSIGRMTGKATTLNPDKFRIMRQRNWLCDISDTVGDLGYRPRYSLERGVTETINWYKEQKWL